MWTIVNKALITILSVQCVWAAGTYELQNKSGSHQRIDVDAARPGNYTGPIEAGVERVGVFNVTIKSPNERIDIYASTHQNTVDVAVWCGANAQNFNYRNDYTSAVETYNIQSPSNNNDPTGYIYSWNDVVRVQNLNTRINAPLTFNPITDGCGLGEYTVRIYAEGNTKNNAYTAFDISVRDFVVNPNCWLYNIFGQNGLSDNAYKNYCSVEENIKKGRVWTSILHLSSLNFTSPVYTKLYVLTGTPVLNGYEGFVWKVDLNGVQPYGFHMYSNSNGAYPQQFFRKSAPASAGAYVSPEYRIYLNPPDVNVQSPPQTPSLSNIQYIPSCTPSGEDNGGVFNFTASEEWRYTLYADANNDGLYKPDEIIIEGVSSIGTNTVAWSGNYANGNPVPDNTILKMNLNVRSGEMHFAFYDIENEAQPAGPTIELFSIPQTSASVRYHWNDYLINSDATDVNGSTQIHTWNDVSVNTDETIIDTWKYAYDNNYEIIVNYGNECAQPASISGYIFNDMNHNGILDSQDGYFNNKTVVIKSTTQSQCYISTTNSSGYFNDTIIPDNYDVYISNENTAACPVYETIPNTIETTPSQLNLTISGDILVNMGFFQGSKINGTVFNDNKTVHDGIKSANEYGINGYSVQLFDNMNSIIESTYSDTDGNYELWVPDTYASVTIATTNKEPWLDISINNTYGSSVNNKSTILNPNAGTQYTNINFGKVKKSLQLKNQSITKLPGNIVYFNNAFKNNTATTNTTIITNEFKPNNDWNAVLYNDSECDESVANNSLLNGSYGINDGTACHIVKIQIPNSANIGDIYSFDICTDVQYNNTTVIEQVCATNTLYIDASGSANLTINKSANKISAKPGENIIYTIELINESLSNVKDMEVFDSTPLYTTFVSANCPNSLPSLINDCIYETDMVNNEGNIVWSIDGELQPNESIMLNYEVNIKN
jgi:uncharacterized repeat protein (TIGR01451 family)